MERKEGMIDEGTEDGRRQVGKDKKVGPNEDEENIQQNEAFRTRKEKGQHERSEYRINKRIRKRE